MKKVRQIKDLQAQMRSHSDVGMALKIQAAINTLMAEKSINAESLLTNENLGKIRSKLYEVDTNSDPFTGLFQAMMGQTANSTEAALQFIEKEMGLFV